MGLYSWVRRLFANQNGEVAFKGKLSMRVTRAKATRWQRLLDKIRGIG